MLIAYLEASLRTRVTLRASLSGYTPPAPGGGPLLDLSDAANTMYLGMV